MTSRRANYDIISPRGGVTTREAPYHARYVNKLQLVVGHGHVDEIRVVPEQRLHI